MTKARRVDRVKELRTIARRASGHASFVQHLQKLTGCTDEDAEAELARRLADDLEDYRPGRIKKDGG